MQKPAITAAKQLGCYVTAADGNKDAYCVSLCDEFVHIDLKNIDALCAYALSLKKNNSIDAVFTAGTDFSASCAKIADVCGLPSHSYEAALNASDKIRMRSCFQKYGVGSPKFIEIDDKTASLIKPESCMTFLAEKGLSETAFPFVVKPVDNMGARGCRMVRTVEELGGAVRTAVEYSRTKRAILEEYMEGPEFSIDSLVYNGTVTVTGFADRHIYYPPYFIEMGHTMPTVLSREDKELIIEEFCKGVLSLGLSCGAAKGDIKLTKSGPKIGEIAARLSGGYMSGWTYPYASGINLTEQALLIAMGEKPSIALTGKSIEPAKTSAERAWISIPGIVQSVIGLEDAEKAPYVKDVFPRVKEGDAVSFPVNNVEKCGNVLSCAREHERAVESAEKAVQSIILRLKGNVKETENFLEQDLHTEFPPSAFCIPAKEAETLISLSRGKTISIKEIADQNISVLPPVLKDMQDWNHKSAELTLMQFLSLCANEELCFSKTLDAALFWKYFLRGGLQGILYLFDSGAR